MTSYRYQIGSIRSLYTWYLSESLIDIELSIVSEWNESSTCSLFGSVSSWSSSWCSGTGSSASITVSSLFSCVSRCSGTGSTASSDGSWTWSSSSTSSSLFSSVSSWGSTCCSAITPVFSIGCSTCSSWFSCLNAPYWSSLFYRFSIGDITW